MVRSDPGHVSARGRADHGARGHARPALAAQHGEPELRLHRRPPLQHPRAGHGPGGQPAARGHGHELVRGGQQHPDLQHQDQYGQGGRRHRGRHREPDRQVLRPVPSDRGRGAELGRGARRHLPGDPAHRRFRQRDPPAQRPVLERRGLGPGRGDLERALHFHRPAHPGRLPLVPGHDLQRLEPGLDLHRLRDGRDGLAPRQRLLRPGPGARPRRQPGGADRYHDPFL